MDKAPDENQSSRYERLYARMAKAICGQECNSAQDITREATRIIKLLLGATDKDPESVFDINRVRHGISGSYIIELMQKR